MVSEPLSLDATASAQDAAQALAAPGGARGLRLRRREARRRRHAQDARPRGRRARAAIRRRRRSARSPRSRTRRSSRIDAARRCVRVSRGGGLRARARGRGRASSSACSRARSCSGGSPRTSRRSTHGSDARAEPIAIDQAASSAGAASASSVSSASRSPCRTSSSTSRPSVVELLVRMADGQLDVGDARAHRAEHLAQLGRRPDAAERAGARAITATGLLRNAFVAIGREPQSSAFLSAPGIDELYSGVAKTTRVGARGRARGTPRPAPGAGTTSSSWSYGGISFRPSQSETSTPSGASSRSARRRRRRVRRRAGASR